MSRFQIITLGLFGIFLIAGLAFLATYKGKDSEVNDLPQITMWGTVPNNDFSAYKAALTSELGLVDKINYTEKKEKNFIPDFIATLARGQSPDAVIVPLDILASQSDKFNTIPFTIFPERDYKDAFLQIGEQLLTSSGLIGIPFSVDPLVMYWNRDMFNKAGIPNPPKTWGEVQEIVPKLSQKNGSTITKSAIALGEYRNITNAKEVLSTLIMQAGDPIVFNSGVGPVVTLGNENTNGNGNPSEEALKFYVDFANPNSKNYSWNRSLPSSQNMFIAGNLGMYIGFASEIRSIREKNPNLNFDVTLIPQAKNSKREVVYGKLLVLAYPIMSTLTQSAFAVTNNLLISDAQKVWSSKQYLPSVSRTLIEAETTDPYMTMFNRQAIIADSWQDPDKIKTDEIFKNMIENYASGVVTASGAVKKAGQDIGAIFIDEKAK